MSLQDPPKGGLGPPDLSNQHRCVTNPSKPPSSRKIEIIWDFLVQKRISTIQFTLVCRNYMLSLLSNCRMSANQPPTVFETFRGPVYTYLQGSSPAIYLLRTWSIDVNFRSDAHTPLHAKRKDVHRYNGLNLIRIFQVRS